MKINWIFYIILGSLLFSACRDEKFYTLEGHIRGLVDPVLYIKSFEDKTDTISSKYGEFRYEAVSDSIQSVLIYMENGAAYITIWAQNGQLIEISGNAEYPELIESNGNEINDLLTNFRQENKAVIKERNDTDDPARKAELMQILIENSQDFIRQHPASIASLVLIQDYLMKSKDLNPVTDALSLIESPAKNSALYKQLQAVIDAP